VPNEFVMVFSEAEDSRGVKRKQPDDEADDAE